MPFFSNENCCILIKFSLKYVRKGPIDNNPALVQIMTWRLSGDKSLSEPMMISLPTHICVTLPQWVKVWWPRLTIPCSVTKPQRDNQENLISLKVTTWESLTSMWSCWGRIQSIAITVLTMPVAMVTAIPAWPILGLYSQSGWPSYHRKSCSWTICVLVVRSLWNLTDILPTMLPKSISNWKARGLI